MSDTATARGPSALARLLFLLLLLLGTVGMHTLGHPREPGPAMRHVAAAEAAHAPAGMPAAMPAPLPDGADHGPRHAGPDPASTCVAVLLGGLVLGLAALALRRPPSRRAAGFARGLWGRMTAALPPPRPPDPTHLSVLRI